MSGSIVDALGRPAHGMRVQNIIDGCIAARMSVQRGVQVVKSGILEQLDAVLLAYIRMLGVSKGSAAV